MIRLQKILISFDGEKEVIVGTDNRARMNRSICYSSQEERSAILTSIHERAYSRVCNRLPISMGGYKMWWMREQGIKKLKRVEV